jgi:uncharacterized membrane protein YfcA
VSWLELAWVAVSVGLASFAQSLSGFGFSLLSVPIMTLVVSPKDAVIISTLLGAVSTTTQAIVDRAHRDWTLARRLAVAAYLGMPIGLVIFVVVSESVLRAVLGVVVISATVLLARGFTLKDDTRIIDWLMGFASGALSTSTSTNGPPLVFLMQARGLTPEVFRATLNTVFALSNIGALGLFLAAGKIDGNALTGVMVALPALGTALVIGYRLRPLIRSDRFRRMVLGMLVLSGVSVLIAAFTH